MHPALTNSAAPLFSIVTVVLNNREGLRRTAESISSQRRPLYEWLVIDGGSRDGTCEVVLEFEEFVDYFISEPDRSLYDAMNKGLFRASGIYVLFLNSGDCLVEGVLAQVADAITRSGSVNGYAFVVGAAIQSFPSGYTRIRRPVSFDEIWHRMPASHQATFVNRIEHLRVPHDTAYPISSDYYTVATIYRTTELPVLLLPFPVAVVLIGGSSFSSRNFYRMLWDHYRFQRHVLNVPFFPLVFSLFRKLLIAWATRALSVRWRPELK